MDPVASGDTLEKLFNSLLLPFNGAKEGEQFSLESIEGIFEAITDLGDFDLPCRHLLQSTWLDKHRARLAPYLRPEDRLEKKGLNLSLHLKGPRAIEIPGKPFRGFIQKSFSMALSFPGRSLSDPEVASRYEKALASVKEDLGEGKVEAFMGAAILPQKKKMLSVETPVQVEVMGMRVSIRFLIGALHGGRMRLFVAGPMIREIEL